MTTTNNSPGYWSGVATGMFVLAVFAFLGLALYFAPNQAAMYREFSGSSLPALTKIALSITWGIAVPAVALAGVVALHGRRFASENGRAIALFTMAFGVLFTYWAMVMPIFELADNIQ